MTAPPSYQNPPWRDIKRRACRKLYVGTVPVGGDAPVSVQSMTNTPTHDVDATLAQIHALDEAGADIVRVSCPDKQSTAALKSIVAASPVPIVADVHFHAQRAIEAAEAGAACLRINPGNIGSAQRVANVVAAARAHHIPMRIGVNAGSLEKHLLAQYGAPTPEALRQSALDHARILQELDFHDFKISIKASDVFLTLAATRLLAEKIDCPLHIGVTEAGTALPGTIKSSVALGALLLEGIGDTIRISLAADPVEEIRAGRALLRALGLSKRGVTIIACPSCARQGFDVIATAAALEERLAHIKAPITLSIIGCVVNGPGEALTSDIGFTGGGAGAGMIYLSGRAAGKLSNEALVEKLAALVEEKARDFEKAT